MIKKLIKMFQTKWIQGECRKLCGLCPNWDLCRNDFEFKSKYYKGLERGYELGYLDGLKDALDDND